MPLRAPPSGMRREVALRVLRAKSRALDAVWTVSGVVGGSFSSEISRPDFLSPLDRFVVGTLRSFRIRWLKSWGRYMGARGSKNRTGGRRRAVP